MPAISRCIAPPALALVLGGVGSGGLAVSELYERNYEDPMVGLWCVGVTASGFEQGAGVLDQYTPPDTAEIERFHEQGSNCFRVPITWNRLQSSLGSTELDPVPGTGRPGRLGFVETIRYITEDLEDYAIVVPYGGGLRHGNQEASMDDFVNLWTAISKEFAQNDRVIFELYNYPEYGCYNGDCGDNNNGFFGFGSDNDGAYVKAWLEWCQGAVDAIRAQGAHNYVLVPGMKRSSCRDWTGAQFWGEILDDEGNLSPWTPTSSGERAGNLRLFALRDPSNRTAYSMRQYFDSSLNGLGRGCEGHDVIEYSGWAADEALNYTIAMAQKYNKKLWMTEVASFPDPDASAQEREWCESKMKNYLSTMADSGVFLGYQVWQFGCSTCGNAEGDYTQDLSSMPDATNNLDWYDLEKYGITSTITSNTETTVSKTTITSSTVTTSTCTGCTQTSSTATTVTAVTSTTLEAAESDGARSTLPGAAGLLATAAALVQLPTC
jgi:hypothetical protein